MFSIFRQCCARSKRVAFHLGIIGGAIALATNSPAIAGSIGSSSSIQLQVVDQAGPVWADYQFVGTDTHGLPSLEIYEKIHDNGDESLWADVEVKVTVYHDSSSGSGNIFKDIWEDIFDNIFGKTPWGSKTNDEEVDPNFTFIPDDLIVGIDKFVKNKSGVHWENFLISLGTGVGNDPQNDPFVPSTMNDGLYFVGDPMPKEVTSYYDPLQPNGNPTPDNLLWTANGMASGQDHLEQSIFWSGVHIPAEMFVQDHQDPDYWHARFTIRQHANTPEPTTITLGLIGVSAGLLGRRKRRV